MENINESEQSESDRTIPLPTNEQDLASTIKMDLPN